MKLYSRVLFCAAGFLFLLVLADSGLCEGEITRIADGKLIGFAGMIEDIKGSSIVFAGELHDSREHHRIQLDVIKALHKAGVPLAIGLEMFDSENQPALDQWVAGKMELLDFVQIYRQNWTIPWPMYDSILLYARNNGIPLIALNVPRDIVQKVYRSGVSSLSVEEKKVLPPDITCRIDAPYMKFIKSIYAGHLTEGSSLEYFCEAQLLRNKTMAWYLMAYLKKNPQRLVVVLTGVGHAMKRGVPEEIPRESGLRYRVIIPQLSEPAMDTLKKSDADYLIAQ
ncbi:MAG: hypothetical protein FD174_3606 [Geobacteraceae bacterium]|nr:MAG: hypothetical protein FD174_3606 [Geobacteraceae bacterium]